VAVGVYDILDVNANTRFSDNQPADTQRRRIPRKTQ
jgi:hypothetical protein